jgi:hypothetical protein
MAVGVPTLPIMPKTLSLSRSSPSVLPCRQIVAEHDGTDAVGAMSASQTWARTDKIRTKLEAPLVLRIVFR